MMHRYRLRVENCIGTIIDVHRSITHMHGNTEFLNRFQLLKKTVNDMDMNSVSEGDVLKVEQATNALLGEFRPIFETENQGFFYEKTKH